MSHSPDNKETNTPHHPKHVAVKFFEFSEDLKQSYTKILSFLGYLVTKTFK